MIGLRKPVFESHVRELRHRVLAVVAVFALGAGAGYWQRGQLIELLRHPLHQHLFYTSPSGGLQFIMQVCGLAGALLALPFGVYNLIRFIDPAIRRYRHLNRRRVLGVVMLSYALAAAGAAFAYMLILPVALRFFASFNIADVQSMITADKYFPFVINCIGVFAAIFQLPLLMLIINFIHPLPPRRLRRWRPWVIAGSFIVALVLPFSYDPLTQVLMAAPIIVLYELSILVIAATNRRSRVAQARIQASAQTAPELRLAPAVPSNPAQPVQAAPKVDYGRRVQLG